MGGSASHFGNHWSDLVAVLFRLKCTVSVERCVSGLYDSSLFKLNPQVKLLHVKVLRDRDLPVIYLPYLTSPRVRSCCCRAIIWPQLSATVSPRLEEVDEQTVHIWHKHLLNKVIQFSGKWHQHRILQPLHMPAPCQKRSPAEPQTLVTRDIIGCQRSPKWHSANCRQGEFFFFFFSYNQLRRGFFFYRQSGRI